jgi:hypothetical protein
MVIDCERVHQAQRYRGCSTFQNNKTALFARTRGYSGTKYHGEICPAKSECDGSMHLNMYSADIEHRPLCSREWGGENLICPVLVELTLVYSPGDKMELDIMKDVIKAGGLVDE